jgi:hypothetical protein
MEARLPARPLNTTERFKLRWTRPNQATGFSCFYDNKAAGGTLTSQPVSIEQPSIDGQPCDRPGSGGDAALYAQLGCATINGPCTVPHSNYPWQTRIDYAVLPALGSMPDPCSGVPQNAYCKR